MCTVARMISLSCSCFDRSYFIFIRNHRRLRDAGGNGDEVVKRNIEVVSNLVHELALDAQSDSALSS